MARYVLNRVVSGHSTLFLFVTLHFSLVSVLVPRGLRGFPGPVALCAGYLVLLGLKDVAFRSPERTRSRPGVRRLDFGSRVVT